MWAIGAVLLAASMLLSRMLGTDAAQCPAGAGHVRDSIESLCTGTDFTCTLLTNGSAVCFGDGSSGQLGTGSASNVLSAASATSLNVDATQIACGAAHVCAVSTSRTLHCWGDGAAGQLGYGSTDSIGDDEVLPSDAVSLGTDVTTKQVVAGDAHTCALSNAGAAFCFGDGGDGRLGYGSSDSVGDDELPSAVGPVDVGGAEIGELAAGRAHTCALFSAGNVACWGAGSNGQLGTGSSDSIGDDEVLDGNLVNVDLGAGRTATKIFAGGNRSCAVLDNGSGLCWGAEGVALGQPLHTGNLGDDEAVSSVDVLDFGGEEVTSFALGDEFVCAVLGDDSSVCWGESRAALGQGSTGDVTSPVESVTLGVGAPVSMLSAGANHACAVTRDETALCWGTETGLGRGRINEDIGDDEAPYEAEETLVIGMDVYVCEQCDIGLAQEDVQDADEDVVCERCPLGSIATNASVCEPCGAGSVPSSDGLSCEQCDAPKYQATSWSCEECSGDLVPNENRTECVCGSGEGRATLPAVDGCSGESHTCIITDDGDVMCWGYGDYAQLGYGNTNEIGDNENPADAGVVNIGTDVTATSISCGEYHTCIITDDGDVMCWGYGSYGRLGYGNTNYIGAYESPADAGVVNIGTDVTAMSISCGKEHTCIITDGGDVMCWGRGSYGRLGYGNTDNIGDGESPASAGVVNIGTDVTATSISCGDEHTCIITDDGDVMCWGNGGYGQLGYGNTDSIGDGENPASAGVVNIGTDVTATSIECGYYHTCIITDGGDVMCWGYGGNGRLGYGNTANIGDGEDPASAGVVNIGTDVTATSISCGADHTCIITDDGDVVCWGRGGYGRLGYGNTDSIGDDEDPVDAGTVDIGVFVDSCEQCSAGFYPDTTSVPHLCTQCSGASISSAGDDDCTPCDTDEAAVDNVCTACGDGEVPSEDRTSCVECAAGEYESAAGVCSTCAAGSVSSAGSAECTACDGEGEYAMDSESCGTCSGDLVPNDDRTDCVCGSGEERVVIGATRGCSGTYHTCIINDDGDVMCWGRGSYGQLGYGNTNPIGDNESPASAGVVNILHGPFSPNVTHIGRTPESKGSNS